MAESYLYSRRREDSDETSDTEDEDIREEEERQKMLRKQYKRQKLEKLRRRNSELESKLEKNFVTSQRVIKKRKSMNRSSLGPSYETLQRKRERSIISKGENMKLYQEIQV